MDYNVYNCNKHAYQDVIEKILTRQIDSCADFFTGQICAFSDFHESKPGCSCQSRPCIAIEFYSTCGVFIWNNHGYTVFCRFSKKFILPCFLYCHNEKPNMLTYLVPLMEALKNLSEKGKLKTLIPNIIDINYKSNCDYLLLTQLTYLIMLSFGYILVAERLGNELVDIRNGLLNFSYILLFNSNFFYFHMLDKP